MGVGSPVDRVLSERDKGEGPGNRRAFGPRAPARIPCDQVFDLWESTRSADHSLYVQAQLSPKVCRLSVTFLCNL
jgi:hypothetical protein